MCPRAGRHLRRQKDHEDTVDTLFGGRSVFDGDAYGHLPELRPAVRQVFHDGADAIRLLWVVVPAERASPHVKPVGLSVISRGPGTPDAHSLIPCPRAIRELGVRVDRAFHDPLLTIDVDDERTKVAQEDGRPCNEFAELVLHGLHGLSGGARSAAVQTQSDDGHMTSPQQFIHFRGRNTLRRKREQVRGEELTGLGDSIGPGAGQPIVVRSQLVRRPVDERLIRIER